MDVIPRPAMVIFTFSNFEKPYWRFFSKIQWTQMLQCALPQNFTKKCPNGLYLNEVQIWKQQTKVFFRFWKSATIADNQHRRIFNSKKMYMQAFTWQKKVFCIFKRQNLKKGYAYEFHLKISKTSPFTLLSVSLRIKELVDTGKISKTPRISKLKFSRSVLISPLALKKQLENDNRLLCISCNFCDTRRIWTVPYIFHVLENRL